MWAVWRGIAVGWLALAVAPAARATVLPEAVAWANPGPMPANGVLVFDSAGGSGNVVIVLSQGGLTFSGVVSDIAGGFVGFRPDQPLSPGTYHVVVTRFAFPQEIAFDVEVVEAYTPAPHQLGFSHEVSRAVTPGGNLVCCEPQPETRTLDQGCFYTEMVEKPTLRWTAVSPLPDEHAQQFVYRISASPAESDWRFLGYFAYDEFRIGPSLPWIIEVQASEYCMMAEAQSLIDGAVFSTQVCFPDPGTELVTKPRDNYDLAFSIANCPLPPIGLDQLWCDEMWGDCDYDLQFLSDAAVEKRLQDCEAYGRLCPQPSATPAPGETTRVPGTRSTGPSCSMSTGVSASPALWAIALLLLRSRRRAPA